ncbi:DUF1127 domain-containing protein [Marinomonas balearica]|uniref:Uncharacterized protein YjiS (DUF1127 family) n=1 Tax=Marinomonas balearica TaxID=491947 RepID=A0A4R6MHT2_9GAMM|nr:DUF1127 domain-containing protein [Marinomonas balearica]TDP01245.1 uncharacterized protein YjiS (DUF1127 family) [Marinomonas balearica]
MSHSIHFQAQCALQNQQQRQQQNQQQRQQQNQQQRQQQNQQEVCSELLGKVQLTQSGMLMQRVLRAIARVRHNWRTRSQLAKLNDAALKDIGVTHADAYNELRKPLWK